MLVFNTVEELRGSEELRRMGRYGWQKVKLGEEEVFACTTDQQYDDLIWGHAEALLKELFDRYGIKKDTCELATEVRDFLLEQLDREGIKFVDVFEEY